jgi:hypothetical protein
MMLWFMPSPTSPTLANAVREFGDGFVNRNIFGGCGEFVGFNNANDNFGNKVWNRDAGN